jgi:anti-sigma factor RsiW
MPDPRPLTDDDRAEIVAYLDGELDPAGRQRVESRLNRDPRARTEADTLKRAWDLLDHLPRPDPSPNFAERTLTRVAALPPIAPPPLPAAPWNRRPALGYAAWAAAVLLAVALGYRLGPPAHPPAPPPVDLDTDPVYAKEPWVIEHLPLYLAADNLDYLQALDTPELFGDDALTH